MVVREACEEAFLTMRAIKQGDAETWRRLKGTNQLPKIIAGVRFADGIEVVQTQKSHAA
jgi:hypothetical protein